MSLFSCLFSGPPSANAGPSSQDNGRIRRPEELDVLAQELNHLAVGSRVNEPIMEDDDDSDDEGPSSQAQDGTLLASEPPRPL